MLEAGVDGDFGFAVDEVGDVAAVEVGALGFDDDGSCGGEAAEDDVARGAGFEIGEFGAVDVGETEAIDALGVKP